MFALSLFKKWHKKKKRAKQIFDAGDGDDDFDQSSLVTLEAFNVSSDIPRSITDQKRAKEHRFKDGRIFLPWFKTLQLSEQMRNLMGRVLCNEKCLKIYS